MGFALSFGELRTPAVVGSIQPGSPAQNAGLKPGDRIVALGGRSVDSFEDMVRFVQIRPGQQVRVDFVRGTTPQAIDMTVGTHIERDRFGNEPKIGRLGIGRTAATLVPVSVIEAPLVAIRQTGNILRMMGDVIAQIVSGSRSVKELGGPLSIAKVSGEHLLFYAIEAIRRRPLEAHVQEWAFRGGLAAVLALMVLVTFNDLGSLGLWTQLGNRLAGLIG